MGITTYLPQIERYIESRRDYLELERDRAAREEFRTFCFPGGFYGRTLLSSAVYWQAIRLIREYLTLLTWLVYMVSRLAPALSLLHKLVLIERRWFLLHGAHSPKTC
jgi:hypothetical protein